MLCSDRDDCSTAGLPSQLEVSVEVVFVFDVPVSSTPRLTISTTTSALEGSSTTWRVDFSLSFPKRSRIESATLGSTKPVFALAALTATVMLLRCETRAWFGIWGEPEARDV